MLQKDLSLVMKNVPNPGLPPAKKKCQSHGFKFQICWTCYRRHLPTRTNFSTQLKMSSTHLYHIDQWDLTTGGPFPFVNIHLILLARGACASHARANGLTPDSLQVFVNPNPSPCSSSASALKPLKLQFLEDILHFYWLNPPFLLVGNMQA